MLLQYLENNNEISLRNIVESSFRKTLLLSAASYFEHQIRECILNFATERTNSDIAIIALIKVKVIERQYHTYFKWDGNNANQFFSLFGSDFKEYMQRVVNEDPELQKSIRSFLELGNLRNQLVHFDFASFPLEKTMEEIYGLYKNSLHFVENIPKWLREFVPRNGT